MKLWTIVKKVYIMIENNGLRIWVSQNGEYFMNKENKKVMKSFVMITQVGLSMLTPIFLCVFLGVYIDRILQTSYWFIILLILGILAAFRNVYYLTRQFYQKDLEKEKKEQEYFNNLQKEYESNKDSIKSIKRQNIEK